MRLFQYVVLLFSFLLSFNLKAVDPQIFIMESTNNNTVVKVLQEDGSLLGWGLNSFGILMTPMTVLVIISILQLNWILAM